VDHFPIFVNLKGRRVVVSGAGETAVAKLRLLLKTQATISVYGGDAHADIRAWAATGKLRLVERPLQEGDATCATLLYGANDDPAEDRRAADIGRRAGALVNIVDNLAESAFITPAIVDRDPVTVAIGTEGAAPVLARRIKANVEEALPHSLGALARIGQGFRKQAEALPMGRRRRDFWSRFYFKRGPQALAKGGEIAAREVLAELLDDSLNSRADKGRVFLIGAGPGDPELLTLKARALLHDADVVIHDQLVPQPVLELARREAIVVETGKKGFGPSWRQNDINALMIDHAAQGRHVVRLKSGDPTIFGRLDEEMDALDDAGIDWEIIPGITAASAAAANIGVSLTRRGRNSSLRILTGHDMQGFAEHDWRDLARPDATAAIYMGKRAASFIRGRLLMYGAPDNKPVTIVENASRPDQKILSTTLLALPEILTAARVDGPAILFLGLSPRAALEATDTMTDEATEIL
jgi:uroporphyrin-III C-methyltransferase/precorrin-2 dehydrogenase/sirohydrochlorin ferrochelatase